ncbi:hypothetical protein Shyhy02_29930 [Streptomyces hygroscopicus subsp. hygroscopicus]|nr:hypothetical protein Shyhy02_29930 [Streptomyces hygroscopicus subsp. hygroscopicus]
MLKVRALDFAMTVLSRSKKAAVRGKEWFSTTLSIGPTIRRKLRRVGLPEKALGYTMEVTDRSRPC